MKISVCIIVKNEEKYIKQCIDSVYDIAYEIVVLDTGSTDKTKKIVREFDKVKLFETTWKDDFSLARNECISYALGDWILSIDSDEILELNNFDIQKINLKDYNTFFFKIICPYPESKVKKIYLRHSLFKNNIGINYVKSIHEHLYSKNLKEFFIEDISITIP